MLLCRGPTTEKYRLHVWVEEVEHIFKRDSGHRDDRDGRFRANLLHTGCSQFRGSLIRRCRIDGVVAWDSDLMVNRPHVSS